MTLREVRGMSGEGKIGPRVPLQRRRTGRLTALTAGLGWCTVHRAHALRGRATPWGLSRPRPVQ